MTCGWTSPDTYRPPRDPHRRKRMRAGHFSRNVRHVPSQPGLFPSQEARATLASASRGNWLRPVLNSLSTEPHGNHSRALSSCIGRGWAAHPCGRGRRGVLSAAALWLPGRPAHPLTPPRAFGFPAPPPWSFWRSRAKLLRTVLEMFFIYLGRMPVSGLAGFKE